MFGCNCAKLMNAGDTYHTAIYIYKQRLPFRLSRATRKPQIGRSLRQLRLLQRAKLARVPKSFASNWLFQPSRQGCNYTTFTSDLVCASYKIISRELSRAGSWIMNNNREQISDKFHSVALTLLVSLFNIANVRCKRHTYIQNAFTFIRFEFDKNDCIAKTRHRCCI